MSSLPTIECLRGLRARVVNEELPPPPSPDDQINQERDFFSQLKYLRSQVLGIVSNKSHIRGAYDLFFKAWKLFSSLNEENQYYLPPLYQSTQLKAILSTALRCILARERNMIRGNADNMGHMVLGGVEGAGKTTVMRAIAIGTSALLERMIPITDDFSPNDDASNVLPSEIISKAFQLYYPESQIREEERSINLFYRMNHDVLLILDEFQNVFIFQENDRFAAGKLAASQVHYYSRQYGTYCIIGGSSVDMQKLMFKEGSDETVDRWRRYGYPDFNGSLYAFHTLPCLRSVQELSAYIHIRYPHWEVTEGDIAQILCYTGGVGRWVHDLWNDCKLVLEPIQDRVQFDTTILVTNNVYRRVPQHKFVDNPSSRQLIVYLCCNNSPTFVGSTNSVSDCGGVEKCLVLQALRAANVEYPSNVIEDAVAKSVIYETSDGDNKIQFLRPIDFKIYSAQLPAKQQRLFLLTAVYFMVYGIVAVNDNESKTTDVNAGNALEELVRKGVFSSANINEEAIYDRTVISIADGRLYYKNDDTNDIYVAVDENNFDQLAMKHLTWAKEHGLDGVCFSHSDRKTSSKKSIWYMDMWQCKGGRFVIEIGGANGKMDTAISNYFKHCRLKDVGDKQITEICFKAQVGMCMLVAAIHKSVPSIVIKPRKLVVTTTKKCSPSCIDTLDSWKRAGGVKVEKKVVKHLLSELSSEKTKELGSLFTIDVVVGCRWVINSIPESEDSLRQVAEELLHTDETDIQRKNEVIQKTCVIQ